jgi:LacI family transcriptional regulator
MTIYDIAKLAGVSASSVSRVINDKPGVNPETRRKIKALLEDNNYVPNDIARGLVTRNSRLVGILVPEAYSIHLMEGAYHITGRLSEVNYGTVIIKTGCTPSE